MKAYRNYWEKQSGSLKLKQSQADNLACHKVIVHSQILVRQFTLFTMYIFSFLRTNTLKIFFKIQLCVHVQTYIKSTAFNQK